VGPQQATATTKPIARQRTSWLDGKQATEAEVAAMKCLRRTDLELRNRTRWFASDAISCRQDKMAPGIGESAWSRPPGRTCRAKISGTIRGAAPGA